MSVSAFGEEFQRKTLQCSQVNTAKELSRQDDFADLANQRKSSLQEASRPREIPGERSKFNAHFLELLNRENPSSKAIRAFARRSLNQFHLSGLHSEESVLIEAYIRGVQRIQNGDEIQNPAAWLRGAIYLIVRELHRDQRKTEPLVDRVLETQIQLASEMEEELDDHLSLAKLKTAFQSLTPTEQQLLRLRIVKGCSWGSIRESLMAKDGVDYRETTLRKRKERALQRLRKAYFAQVGP